MGINRAILQNCSLLMVLLFNCTNETKRLESLDSKDTGIVFMNKVTNTGELNILNYLYFYNGSGVSAGDFNNDGLQDLYFTGNQVPDKLYINLGDFKFKDVTAASRINNAANWTTGSTTVDINNDGLLDIYICKIGLHNSIEGRNLLYVNQGIDNGVPVFKESAIEYGLDFKGYATQSVFFDYDQDEDLDMFLLNHSVHPNRNYGLGAQREQLDSISGDRLFRNDNGKFVDVSQEAGIYQGKIGYGLGVSVGDLNKDGYPDLYIGNDFFENDYVYINQKDGTFLEVVSNDRKPLGHTTHFSMGNATSDINNDGNLDIISLDMLPEDIVTYKSSGLEYPYSIYQRYLRNGYAPQFMQNTLHLNNGNDTFSEIAHMSGIAASEWSWSPIVADLDNDGLKDLYITNGILGATNDMDFISFISNDAIQSKLGASMAEKDLSFIEKMPSKKVPNYVFKNNGDNTFENKGSDWGTDLVTYSNGGIQVDLNNDGALDIVVNNINDEALIIKNNSRAMEPGNGYLSVQFKGPNENKFGIGARVTLFSAGKVLVEENYASRGYLSSVAPSIHFGLGESKVVDSLHVVWPGGKFQSISNTAINQVVELDYLNSSGNYHDSSSKETNALLTNVPGFFKFKHQDPASIEYDREPLIPFASTNRGPETSVADVNNDGRLDVFIGGAKSQAAKLFIQQEDRTFIAKFEDLFSKDAISEDISSAFMDVDGDGFKDLVVVSGGNEFKNGPSLNPRLYRNENGVFKKDMDLFNDIEVNASKVKAVDFNNDGFQDISITSDLVPWLFGETPRQYLLQNDGKGGFEDVSESFGKELQTIGNVKDICWTDIDGNGYLDAIVAGDWMPVVIFTNNGKKLEKKGSDGLSEHSGWWNTVEAADLDQDGDIDIVAGNWGKNSRLEATRTSPITLYNEDFDNNGKIDPVVTYVYQGKETPFASKDELAKQLPFLNKEFLSYNDFAKASLTDLFPAKKLENADKKYVTELANCYFENKGNGTFERHELPPMSQISSVNDILVEDFDNDGFKDLFLVGNNYEISTQLGNLDASHGTILLNDQKGFFKDVPNPDFKVSGPARHIQRIRIEEDLYYIITMNNDVPVFLKMNKD